MLGSGSVAAVVVGAKELDPPVSHAADYQHQKADKESFKL